MKTNCKFEFSQPNFDIKGRVTTPDPDDVRNDVSDVRSDVRPEKVGLRVVPCGAWAARGDVTISEGHSVASGFL